MRSNFRQRVTNCDFERTGTAAAETFVESFEALDEIRDMFAWIHATGFGTIVGAAAERAVLIDGAASVAPQEGAGSVRVGFECLAPAGTDSEGCVQSLPTGEHGRVTCQPKVTATGAHLTLAGQRPALEIGINCLNFLVADWLGGGHAVCIQHGGAGFCGTRFLQRAILRFEISHSAPIVLTRDRVQAQFPRHPGSTTIL